MKNTYANEFTVAILLGVLAFLSLTVSAGQDESQRYITQQVQKQQRQAKQEVAKVKQAECMMQMKQGNHISGS